MTASKDRTPHCCTDAASPQTVDSFQHATSEKRSTSETLSERSRQKRDPLRNFNGSEPLNTETHFRNKSPMGLIIIKVSQHHEGSIWCTSNKQNTAQHRDPLQKQIGGNSQKQLPVPINHLKEEPSAPQSLSIFDSTQTEHKMHNWRRPVVEIVICM